MRLQQYQPRAHAGLVGLELTTSTVNGETCFDFARGTLIPNMMPFNGSNPISVVIMENLSVHHASEVKDLLKQAGIFGASLSEPHTSHVSGAFSLNVCIKYRTYVVPHIRCSHNLTLCNLILQFQFLALSLSS